MKVTTLPDPTREPTVSVERAGALLGISRGSAYEAARRGDIPALRIGKRLVVPTARLLALLGVDVGGRVMDTNTAPQRGNATNAEPKPRAADQQTNRRPKNGKSSGEASTAH